MAIRKNVKELLLDECDTGKLITVKSPSLYANCGKMKGWIVRITTESISVYDKDFYFLFALLNTNIVYMSEFEAEYYIYCMLSGTDK